MGACGLDSWNDSKHDGRIFVPPRSRQIGFCSEGEALSLQFLADCWPSAPARLSEDSRILPDSTSDVILDSFQSGLRVSIPALYSPQEIIETAERFYYATGNLFTFSYREQFEKRADSTGGFQFADYEAINRVFESIAAQWPHYVIPPGHAFEVLGPETPCSFFEA